MKRTIALAIAFAAAPLHAATPLSAQIAAEKSAMLSEADNLFNVTWLGDSRKEGAFTAYEYREMMRWRVLGHAYGLCLSYRTPNDITEWNVAFDLFARSLSGGDRELLQTIRETAGSWEASGVMDRTEYSDAELAGLCRVKLPAIRQLIR